MFKGSENKQEKPQRNKGKRRFFCPKVRPYSSAGRNQAPFQDARATAFQGRLHSDKIYFSDLSRLQEACLLPGIQVCHVLCTKD